MTINNQQFEKFIHAESIQKAVVKIANGIDRDYVGKNPLLLPVLNGAFMFAADLMKNLHIASEISFIKFASYKGLDQMEEITELMGIGEEIEGRHILVIEDIVDSGKTLTYILNKIESLKPASVNVVTLLHKPDASRFKKIMKYVGFQIPNKFVVGYGLDFEGWGRNYSDIYQIKGDLE